MNMKTRIISVLTLLLCLMPFVGFAQESDKPVAKKILFIGDSMTGWLSERLEAYGKQNGFEVSTVVWDGSTIKKWGTAPRLNSIVREQNPDAIFISLGMNELFEANPAARFQSSLDAIKGVAGDIPLIWVGPPAWPGHNKGETMNKWLADQLGNGHYFDSFNMNLPRQSKSNPHPTRDGMISWMDQVIEWVKDDGCIALPGYTVPTGEKMTRPKTFIYKRMKDAL